jgi:hypothetical protein
MIYWIQEAALAGAQEEAASSLPSAILSGGLVGAVVGLIGVIIAQVLTQRRHSQTLEQTAELESQRAREAALQKYFEQMREALADPDRPLRRSTMGDDLSTVARAQTLAVLEGLDPDRKRILLQFLYESNLIKAEKTDSAEFRTLVDERFISELGHLPKSQLEAIEAGLRDRYNALDKSFHSPIWTDQKRHAEYLQLLDEIRAVKLTMDAVGRVKTAAA